MLGLSVIILFKSVLHVFSAHNSSGPSLTWETLNTIFEGTQTSFWSLIIFSSCSQFLCLSKSVSIQYASSASRPAWTEIERLSCFKLIYRWLTKKGSADYEEQQRHDDDDTSSPLSLQGNHQSISQLTFFLSICELSGPPDRRQNVWPSLWPGNFIPQSRRYFPRWDISFLNPVTRDSPSEWEI